MNLIEENKWPALDNLPRLKQSFRDYAIAWAHKIILSTEKEFKEQG